MGKKSWIKRKRPLNVRVWRLSILLSQKGERPMDNVQRLTTIRQCLNLLGFEEYRSIFDDHRARKLNTGNCIQLHVMAQLLKLEDYDSICEQLRANKQLQSIIGLDSISASALSRKTNQLCTYSLQDLFFALGTELQTLHKSSNKKSKSQGKICIVDSTDIILPRARAAWANHCPRLRGVKMHTRVIVGDPDCVYPDRIVATTGNVHDIPISIELVEDEELTHIMDRGYQKHEHFDRWTNDNKWFLTRIKENTLYEVLETYESQEPGVILDAKVMLNKSKLPVRLILVQDEKQKVHYFVTNHGPKAYSAVEIADMYRSRWLIELFFKWIKQHLRFVKVFSYSPDGIWNQMYLALIAFVLCQIIKLKTETKESQWDVLKMIRTYAYRSWRSCKKALTRKPTRESKGRQRSGQKDKPKQVPTRIIMK